MEKNYFTLSQPKMRMNSFMKKKERISPTFLPTLKSNQTEQNYRKKRALGMLKKSCTFKKLMKN